MRNFSSYASLFFVPLLALSAEAGAATPIDQTRALDARGRVDIENIKGRIQVRAWERNEVKISGTLGDGVEKLVVEGDSEHLVVKVQYPRDSGWAATNPDLPTCSLSSRCARSWRSIRYRRMWTYPAWLPRNCPSTASAGACWWRPLREKSMLKASAETCG